MNTKRAEEEPLVYYININIIYWLVIGDDNYYFSTTIEYFLVF